ncbi:hypothetical protein [Pseudanabaena sp. UWO310]|nr:hypothetical protein [Pseudanabaena sp. UWO310]
MGCFTFLWSLNYVHHRDRRNLIRLRKQVEADRDLVVNIDEFASVF